jgi:2-succinyl-6-hydroxy-2,4-cyclohexadiene-1-carboxylate synthase
MSTPIVCVHGFLGLPSSWRSFLDALEHRGPVDAITLAGHGPSPWGTELNRFDDVVDALADALPFREPAWLLGYSMGARVALSLAVRHPSRVRGAVLVGANPGLRDASARDDRVAWDDAMADRAMREGIERFASHWELLPLFASQRERHDDAATARRSERRAHEPRGVAWAMRVLGLGRMPSIWDALGDCEVPLRFVAGADDPRFTELAVEAARVARRGTHRRIDGAAHDVTLDAPRALADDVRAWMEVTR